MDFKPISSKWNALDTIIYKIEQILGSVVSQWKESKDPEPDVEEIIAAETRHLQKVNDEYKRMQYPADLILKDDKEYCPACNTEMPEGYIGKCCFECGQRIRRNMSS